MCCEARERAGWWRRAVPAAKCQAGEAWHRGALESVWAARSEAVAALCHGCSEDSGSVWGVSRASARESSSAIMPALEAVSPKRERGPWMRAGPTPR